MPHTLTVTLRRRTIRHEYQTVVVTVTDDQVNAYLGHTAGSELTDQLGVLDCALNAAETHAESREWDTDGAADIETFDPDSDWILDAVDD
tara:strand:+ start:164 stop:433 length:270 start_codon:yes stop_codon:yes gene_type:complete